MTFVEKLRAAAAQNHSLLCVGLDPDPKFLPASVGDRDNPTLYFLQHLIDATADLVCAYKPNFAFFGALGERGWSTLKTTLDHIPPSIPVIIDAKVGDIGNTAEHYARMFFEILGADALTVNPYMGSDAVAPFLAYREKGVFLLCLTSNKGAADFEEQELADGPLYLRVARKACEWNSAGNCGLVVGATQPQARDSFWDDADLSRVWSGPARVWLVTGRPPERSVIARLEGAQLVAVGGGRRLYANR